MITLTEYQKPDKDMKAVSERITKLAEKMGKYLNKEKEMYLWTKDNIVYGSWVCKAKIDQSKKPSEWAITVTYMIGFSVSSSKGSTLHSICDGMTIMPRSKADFVDLLNKHEFVPASAKYIKAILTKKSQRRNLMLLKLMRYYLHYRNFNIPRDNDPPILCIVSPEGNAIQSLTEAEIGTSLYNVLLGCLSSRDSVEVDEQLYGLLKASHYRLEWDLKYEQKRNAKLVDDMKNITGRLDKLLGRGL